MEWALSPGNVRVKEAEIVRLLGPIADSVTPEDYVRQWAIVTAEQGYSLTGLPISSPVDRAARKSGLSYTRSCSSF